MIVLLVFFLTCFALAASSPLYDVDQIGDFGDFVDDFDFLSEQDYWKKLMDKPGVHQRSEDSIDVFGMVQELKKLINEEINPDKIKAFVEKHFGDNKELIESIAQFMKENGKESFEKLRDFVKKLVREMIGAHSKRSCDDVFEEIRKFFKELGIDIKERFTKFGEWVKEQYNKGLEKSKNRLDNIKIIANEFTKKIPVELAEEALDFFRHYKTHLGDVFDDIEEKVKEILKQD